MDMLETFFQGLIDLGAPVFLAIILSLINIVFRMKPTRAISAGLTLGVALAGISLVVDYMIGNVGTAAQAFVDNTGVELNALDMGWPPRSAWPGVGQFAF